MNLVLKNILLFSLLLFITSGKEKEADYNFACKNSVVEFCERLENNQSLSSLMDENWTFIYHQDHRCTGSTDGQKKNLLMHQVDSTITLNVFNNSEDAWACDKKESYNYNLDFSLEKQIENWDRFEFQKEENSDHSEKGENTFYIYGAGESDYIIIHFGKNKLISTLTYSSEDPG